MAIPKQSKEPLLSLERIRMEMQARFDPLPELTPERLTQYHRAFRNGYLRNAALTWESIAETDLTVRSVVPKREKAVARRGYKFVCSEGFEDDPRAKRHEETLAKFYSTLVCTNAMDLDERAGFPLLIRQMMSAVGNRYACHHIIYSPGPRGLSAEFRFVPLYFFERTTGKLRFLSSSLAQYGIDLEPGAWLVTKGDGLMPATAIAYMFKHLPLRDWLIYSERHGAPGIHAVTDAAPDSDEWATLEDAVRYFAIELGIVTNRGAEINSIDVAAKGELPYPKLIDYMDRAISTLWRGGDLSTMSRRDSVGANLQDEEKDTLEEDDIEMITDTLNEQVDRMVIRYVHGEEPLCWIKLNTPTKQDVEQDTKIDQFLIEAGVPQSQEQLASRYNRTLPDEGETPLSPPPGKGRAAPGFFTGLSQDRTSLPGAAAPMAANAAEGMDSMQVLLANSRLRLAEAEHRVLEALAEPLLDIYRRNPDPAERDAELIRIRDEVLPRLMREMDAADGTVHVLREMMSAALANGIEEEATLAGEAA